MNTAKTFSIEEAKIKEKQLRYTTSSLVRSYNFARLRPRSFIIFFPLHTSLAIHHFCIFSTLLHAVRRDAEILK